MKVNATCLALTAILAAVLAAPSAASAQQQWEAGPRRERLEAEILSRFVDRAARELELDADRRARLENLLRASAERRAAIARESWQLRQKLVQALHDPSTPDDEFERLVDEVVALRKQQEEQWREDQRALADVLTPRQHARFMVMLARFHERVRQLRDGSR